MRHRSEEREGNRKEKREREKRGKDRAIESG